MDLSRVLGEFYDEHDDELAAEPAAPSRRDLAAALSEAVARPDAEPDDEPDDQSDPVAGNPEPDAAWHRGDDDVLPPRRRGPQMARGRRGRDGG